MFFHILTSFVQILALFLPPFKYRALVFTPLIITLIYITIQSASSSKDLDFQALVMNSWPWSLATLEKVLFTTPEHDFWRADRPKAEAASMPMMGLSKLRWSTALRFNLRGVGWNYQVKNVPRSMAPQTKWRFILHQLGVCIKTYLMLDILSTYSSRNFYRLPDVDMASLTIRDPSWFRSFVNALYAGANFHYSIQLTYTQGSIIAVLLGLSKPKDWPPVFGNIRDVTTVRYFWGGFWHQLIRRPFSSWSQALVSLLHIPRGTRLSSYTQLYATFAISGFFHGVTSHIAPGSRQHGLHESFWLFFNFFILQAVAIQCEDAVIGGYERIFEKGLPGRRRNLEKEEERRTMGEKKKGGGEVEMVNDGVPWKVLLGYIWVICWFWFSLGWGGDANLKSGLFTIKAAKISIVRPLLRLE